MLDNFHIFEKVQDDHSERLNDVESYTKQLDNDLQKITGQMGELLSSVNTSRTETQRRFGEFHTWNIYVAVGISGASGGACGAVFWALSHFFG